MRSRWPRHKESSGEQDGNNAGYHGGNGGFPQCRLCLGLKRLSSLGIGRNRFQLDTNVADRLPSPLLIFFKTTAENVVNPWMDIRRKRLQVRIASEDRGDRIGQGS